MIDHIKSSFITKDTYEDDKNVKTVPYAAEITALHLTDFNSFFNTVVHDEQHVETLKTDKGIMN